MPYISMLSVELPSQSTMVLLVGLLLLVLGIVGGGWEIKEIRIPAIGGLPRLISAVAGVLLLGLSIGVMGGLGRTVSSGTSYALMGGQPYFMTRELTASDVQGKDYLAINEMKNEIFARHGRRFQDASIQKYFSAQSWYKPVYSPGDFPVSLLTPVQQKNVDFLSQTERGLAR